MIVVSYTTEPELFSTTFDIDANDTGPLPDTADLLHTTAETAQSLASRCCSVLTANAYKELALAAGSRASLATAPRGTTATVPIALPHVGFVYRMIGGVWGTAAREQTPAMSYSQGTWTEVPSPDSLIQDSESLHDVLEAITDAKPHIEALGSHTEKGALDAVRWLRSVMNKRDDAISAAAAFRSLVPDDVCSAHSPNPGCCTAHSAMSAMTVAADGYYDLWYAPATPTLTHIGTNEILVSHPSSGDLYPFPVGPWDWDNESFRFTWLEMSPWFDATEAAGLKEARTPQEKAQWCAQSSLKYDSEGRAAAARYMDVMEAAARTLYSPI